MGSFSQGRIIVSLVLILLGVSVGLFTGYYLWFEPSTESFAAVPGKQRVIEVPSEAQPPNEPPALFKSLEADIIELVGRRRYADALEKLVELDLLAASTKEIAQVSSLLEEAVKLRAVQLESRGRLADIDALYESLTFNMPERAEYFLLLAEHRIRMGTPETALPVLAQIENHHQLGGHVRELIGTLTKEPESPPLASVSLTRRRDQYLVDVTIDHNYSATLMMDTGASTTILTPALISRLGYRSGARESRFSTAGGPVTAPLIEIESVALADAEVSPLTVGVLDLTTNKVDGLLGMDFLSQFDWVVIHEQDMLVLRALKPG
ncbi:MAG: clan AA aspartic protease [Gammaproteobacteria bacterium]|jgi:clan AA aspartic protease (TIGR02281 family)|nr:clan AA aspartic protease [Gammaproteobacteria bacterium]MBT4493068.1 clan AA aspartic protease [Gammaproteobacteria bacterium]MBT7371243.1 clan AA aspartic protease [Gammaproteobacteria bacterium]